MRTNGSRWCHSEHKMTNSTTAPHAGGRISKTPPKGTSSRAVHPYFAAPAAAHPRELTNTVVGNVLAVVVTGSIVGSTVDMTFSYPDSGGVVPADFRGTWNGGNTITGNLNNSGYDNNVLVLIEP